MRWVAGLGLAGALWCAGVIVYLFAGGRPPTLNVVITVSALLVIPTVLIACGAGFALKKDASHHDNVVHRNRPATAVPRRIRFALIGFGVAFVAVFFFAYNRSHPAGTPEIERGVFVLSPGIGAATPVDEPTYDAAISRIEELFLAGFGVVGLGSGMAALSLDGIRGQ